MLDRQSAPIRNIREDKKQHGIAYFLCADPEGIAARRTCAPLKNSFLFSVILVDSQMLSPISSQG